MKRKNNEEIEVNEGAPICEKCGNVKVEEIFDGAREKEWVCPQCDTKIDFFGGGDNE